MTRKTTKKKVSPLKGRMKTPPFQNYPAWSQAKFFSFVRSGLRGTYNRYPPKWEVLHAARRPYEGKDKRCKWEFQCAECKLWHKSTEVSVDHITPAGSLNCFEDIQGFVERLFCSKDELQVLCKHCHNTKTQEERNKTND